MKHKNGTYFFVHGGPEIFFKEAGHHIRVWRTKGKKFWRHQTTTTLQTYKTNA